MYILLLQLTLVYFIVGNRNLSGPSDLCVAANRTMGELPLCAVEETRYFGLLMLAQALHGAGYTPLIVLGPVFVDSNTDHGMASVYIGE